MGAFGIYALVVTFIFVIYYIVTICMDLFSTKGEKKENVEVIHTGTPLAGPSPIQEIQPDKIKEVGDGRYQIDRNGQQPEVFGKQADAPSSDDKDDRKVKAERSQQPPRPERPFLSAADIANEDDEQLARESQSKVESLKENFTPVSPEIQGAVYLDDFMESCQEDYQAALLGAKQADHEAELLSD